jgi:hypothetical protein
MTEKNETPQDRSRIDLHRYYLDAIAVPMALDVVTNYAHGDGSHHIPLVLGRDVYGKLHDQITEANVDLRDGNGNDNFERRLGEFEKTIHTAIAAAHAEAARTASLIRDLTGALDIVTDEAWASSETPPATTPYLEDDDAQD